MYASPRTSRPSTPASRAFRTFWDAGAYRFWKTTDRWRPAFRQASMRLRALASVTSMGFSTITCLPASAARIPYSA